MFYTVLRRPASAARHTPSGSRSGAHPACSSSPSSASHNALGAACCHASGAANRVQHQQLAHAPDLFCFLTSAQLQNACPAFSFTTRDLPCLGLQPPCTAKTSWAGAYLCSFSSLFHNWMMLYIGAHTGLHPRTAHLLPWRWIPWT